MSKKMLIDATHPEETRVVVVEGNKVDEFDFESLNKRQLAGNIYLAKVTRVEPSLQAAFIDYGGNRHGFLAFNEIHPDYYQIPVADRERLLAEEAAYAKAKVEEDAKRAEQPKSRNRRRKKAAKTEAESEGSIATTDAIVTSDVIDNDVIDIDATGSDLVDVPEAQAATKETVAAPDAPVDEDQPVASDETASDVATEVNNSETAAEADEKPVEVSTDIATDKADEAPSTGEEIATSDDKTPPTSDETDEDTDNDEVKEEKQKPGIESVADDDVSEEVRPRKPRMRRYKIQEVVKVRQIMLVQVVKEERGNKGAALTTYLSLAGRYCVLMPNTARGGGISRKITNAADRKKIKTIANNLVVPDGAGLIIRTAGASRNEADINRDYEFLTRQWEQIRELTLKSIAPAPIYEEGNLIKRSIRDLYTRDIEEIHVEGDAGYEAAREYMKMFMPNRVDKVKQYKEQMPLFSRYQVESHLGAMFNPTVQLKSGGYLVIGITEALVAVDVNSGKATKESSIEATALKTNLEAAEEVARQMRLRDLAGLIVIDFIDMDERRNNTAVEKRLKDKLKTDRARIQIGRISGFGLLEMSRQRLRPGMLEATTQPCPHCHATGLLRSDDSLALSILRELEEEGVRNRSGEILVKTPINVANYLLNEKRDHISTIETRYGMSVRIEADVNLIGTEYSFEKFKTTTRVIAKPVNAPVSMENVSMESFDNSVSEASTDQPSPTDDTEEKPKKKSRRRRGGRGRGKAKQEQQENAAAPDQNNDPQPVEAKDTAKPLEETSEVVEAKQEPVSDTPAEVEVKQDAETPVSSENAEPAEEKKPVKRRRKAVAKKPAVKEDAPEAESSEDSTATTEKKKPAKKTVAKKAPAKPKVVKAKTPRKKAAVAEPTETVEAIPTPEPIVVETVPVQIPEPVVVAAEVPEVKKPKRRGWWSRG